MIRILWVFLPATLLVSGMQNPAPLQAGVRKYSCCPEKFGYHFVQMNGNQAGRENIHLTDFEETKTCSERSAWLFAAAYLNGSWLNYLLWQMCVHKIH